MGCNGSKIEGCSLDVEASSFQVTVQIDQIQIPFHIAPHEKALLWKLRLHARKCTQLLWSAVVPPPAAAKILFADTEIKDNECASQHGIQPGAQLLITENSPSLQITVDYSSNGKRRSVMIWEGETVGHMLLRIGLTGAWCAVGQEDVGREELHQSTLVKHSPLHAGSKIIPKWRGRAASEVRDIQIKQLGIWKQRQRQYAKQLGIWKQQSCVSSFLL